MFDGLIDFEQLLKDATQKALATSKDQPSPLDRESLLNGVPYQAFRHWVSLEDRRRDGTFFSSGPIADDLARRLQAIVHHDALVMDPTCGMGDLLLAYAALLPLKKSLHETIASWGAKLGGIELRSELVRMTKARLILLARARGQFQEALSGINGYFPNIVVGDMLRSKKRLLSADGFLFNPPFGQTSEHNIDRWGTGRLSAAAIFLDHLIARKRSAAPIAAILPEVLRCGSRYSSFREHIEALGHAATYKSVGRFDSWADVDVFTTLISQSDAPVVWRSPPIEVTDMSVGDLFEVRVGPVVPHRHEHKGPWRKVICARTVPAWSVGYEPERSRRFRGVAFSPPFVVVRRTSSPSDKFRAVGAVIVGTRPVAVENHLIVLSPRQGGAEMCFRLMRVLKNPGTSTFLNEAIRCRHLTTGSVMAIPWNDSND